MQEYTPAAMVKVKNYRGRERDYNYDPLSLLAAQGTSEIRHDVGEASADIHRTIHQQTIANAAGFCDVQAKIGDAECRIANRQADDFGKIMLHTANLERDLQNVVWDQGRHLTTLIGDKTDKVLEKVGRENDQLNRDLQNHRVETIREFGNQKLQLCEVENRLARQIEMCCCKITEKIDGETISRLKDELEQARLKNLFRENCTTSSGGR